MINKANALDLIGIGIGPNNLGLGALLTKTSLRNYSFFDQRNEFQWHPGLLFPEATMQVSFLKDLVTMIDPTNCYSFLAFMADRNRLYRFANGKNGRIKRYEFNEYYRWAVERMNENLEFDNRIENIEWNGNNFEVFSNNGVYTTKNLVLGSGLVPKIPECVAPYLGETVFHAINYTHNITDLTGKRVAVVGGGQSGAEITRRILGGLEGRPDKFHWVTSRQNFMPIDDSPFANEYFSPAYSVYYNSLSDEEKSEALKGQILASDGIDNHILDEIYQQMADIQYFEKDKDLFTLFPASRVVDMGPSIDGWKIAVKPHNHYDVLDMDVDIVILATGFEYRIPPYMESLSDLLFLKDEKYIVNEDFSLSWEGEEKGKIYVQNAALCQRGIADPNLSLSAWRNAKIINSVLGEDFYDTKANESDSFFQWNALKSVGVNSAIY